MKDAKDDGDFFTKICDWSKLHDFWVEKLWPYMRDELKVQAMGVVGTGWGSWVATRYTGICHYCCPHFLILVLRLSSYEEVLACVNIQPLISVAVEAAKEDLYEVFEEVRCPTLMASCRNNCPNEKPGGLAQNIFK